LRRVELIMRSGDWFTLAELASYANGSEAGVSARLRDLRQPKHGGYIVERERVSGGLWRYRVNGQQVIQ
jgi:hypothetical protein